jgi:hypothetical protein
MATPWALLAGSLLAWLGGCSFSTAYAGNNSVPASAPLPRGNEPLPELAKDCKGALVATLVQVDEPQLGPPGAADYTSRWKVQKALRGNYPETTSLNFRVQSLPRESQERSPVVGRKYILITYETNETQIAVILDATGDNLRMVEELLKR